MNREKVLKKTIIIIAIIAIICALIAVVLYNGIIKKNMTIITRDNEIKRVYINEDLLKEKINDIISKMNLAYLGQAKSDGLKINQITDIRILYNYEYKYIEKICVSCNYNKYYKPKSMRYRIASGNTIMNRDGTKQTIYDKSEFKVEALAGGIGLIDKDNNEILNKIINEYNKKLDNTFYWEITVYDN